MQRTVEGTHRSTVATNGRQLKARTHIQLLMVSCDNEQKCWQRHHWPVTASVHRTLTPGWYL